jgi:hypothetical protein
MIFVTEGIGASQRVPTVRSIDKRQSYRRRWYVTLIFGWIFKIPVMKPATWTNELLSKGGEVSYYYYCRRRQAPSILFKEIQGFCIMGLHFLKYVEICIGFGIENMPWR